MVQQHQDRQKDADIVDKEQAGDGPGLDGRRGRHGLARIQGNGSVHRAADYYLLFHVFSSLSEQFSSALFLVGR
jgi:hypothetical protein